MSTAHPYPDLAAERAHLARSHACRDQTIARLSRLDPTAGAADELTQQYIEATVADALADLRSPGAGDFFGRIDEEPGPRWYVGRRHIEDEAHNPVVVDWRTAVAAPFYRATVHDPLGLRFRRRFVASNGDLVAYLDEHLDDPTEADVATGIPDPVLAEIGAARTGAMRDIVATIQAEQDVIIRAPLAGCLVVQGGPGTGKTAVGLHRAAYLLFEHRARLAREGLLVVGPNPVFLEYIANVLPSLGERSVVQRTMADLAVPKVPVDAADPVEVARLKGDARMLAVLAAAVRAAIRPPQDDVRAHLGSRTLRFGADEVAGWMAAALEGDGPLQRERQGLRVIAERELLRRTGQDGGLARVPALRDALARAWPSQRPVPLVSRLLSNPEALAGAAGDLLTPAEQTLVLTRRGRARPWTPADQLLVDAAASLLDGPPATYAHVVVDEAQDLSAVALDAIGRRCPSGSMTVLGDLAQSTTPAGQQDWDEVQRRLRAPSGQVGVLTIGYRVPGPILDVANRLLPLTGAGTPPSRSVRQHGHGPTVRTVGPAALPAAVAAEVVALTRHHPLTGVVAPVPLHAALRDALAGAGREAVHHVHAQPGTEVPLFGPEEVKGLEFDAVVVVNAHHILGDTPRGARLLYVALTRAVQHLSLVADAAPPAVLGLDA